MLPERSGCTYRLTFPVWVALFLALAACQSEAVEQEGAGSSLEATTPALQPVRAGDSLAGKFLVAEPQVNDPRFARGVVLLIQHDAQGAMGLLINRVLGPVDAEELLRNLDLNGPAEGEWILYYGGPVEPRRGFILHSTDVVRPTSREVIPGVAFSADATLLEQIAAGKGPRKYRILLGYAGWAPGQLEREIRRGDWTILDAQPSEVFSDDPEHIWERLMGDRILRM